MELRSYVPTRGPPVKVRVIDRPIGQHGAPRALQVVVGVYHPGRDVQRVPSGNVEGRDVQDALLVPQELGQDEGAALGGQGTVKVVKVVSLEAWVAIQ